MSSWGRERWRGGRGPLGRPWGYFARGVIDSSTKGDHKGPAPIFPAPAPTAMLRGLTVDMHGHNDIRIVACAYGFDHAGLCGTIGFESHFGRTNNGQYIREILHVEDDLQFRSVNGGIHRTGIIPQILGWPFDGDLGGFEASIFTGVDLYNRCV